MILSVQNVSKSFEEKPILKNVSFNLEENDKAALIGINGAGKTTLIKLIMGLLSADEGNVTTSKDITIGYLSQEETVDSENVIYDELLLSQKSWSKRKNA